MTPPSVPSGVRLPTVETGLTADELFHTMTSHRRRHVLHVLRRRDGRMGYDALVGAVASSTGNDRDSTSVKLHHLALPKLEDRGLVDRDDGDVTLTDNGWSVAAWLNRVTAG